MISEEKYFSGYIPFTYILLLTLKGHHLVAYSGKDFKCSISIDFEIFKTFFTQSFKIYVKSTYFGPK